MTVPPQQRGFFTARPTRGERREREMEDRRSQRRRPKVACPACQGTGRNGPEGSVCRICWLTGVVDSGRYEKLKSEQERRRGESDPVDEPDEPAAVRLPV
jgi:hypothetical protein